MRAIVQDEYGMSPEVLSLKEIDKPMPAPGELLVRVKAASLFVGDWHVMTGLPYAVRPKLGIRRPNARVAGQEMAGVVEAVGEGATAFDVGDEAFGTCEGAFAEFVSVTEGLLGPKPANVTFEQAATVAITGTTALQALRNKGNVQPGQTALIIGAAGGVGSFATQIATALGARVTGVGSTTQCDLIRSIGAEDVIDYTREDFTKSGRHWDLIVETAGARPISELRHALTREGTLVIVGGEGGGKWFGKAGRMVWAPMLSPFTSQTLTTLAVKHNGADLVVLKELIEAGKVKPVIGATYPLVEVPQAMRDLKTAPGQGKVVISI